MRAAAQRENLPEGLTMQSASNRTAKGPCAGLRHHERLTVNQSTNGWLQELLGCEATSEFSIIGQDHTVMHASEEASCSSRCFWPRLHAFTLTVTELVAPGGPTRVVAQYARPCRLPLSPVKCCCFQEMQHSDGMGAPIGATVEQCSVCVPTLNITDEHGKIEYVVSKPTCCCGTMVDICAEGGPLRMNTPYYLFREGSRHVADQQVGKMVRKYTNPMQEALTDASNFEVGFPDGCSPVAKARILGSVFLVNQTGHTEPSAHHMHMSS